MRKQYNVKITKYALSQMKAIRDYIADELLAPQAAYDLFLDVDHLNHKGAIQFVDILMENVVEE